MKTKTMLLAVIAAVMMAVLCAPVFADGESFSVSAPDPAEQTVLLGETASFTFTINDTSGTSNQDYTVSVSDQTSNGVTAFTDTNIKQTRSTDGNIVTVTISGENPNPATVGNHTLTYTVTKAENENISKTAKITVKAPRLTGYDSASSSTGDLIVTPDQEETNKQIYKSLTAGDPIRLNVVKPSGAETFSCQWQMAEDKGNVYDVNNVNWENIPGETRTTLSAAADIFMDGKFVRCVTTVNGKKMVAQAERSQSLSFEDMATVQLNVSDPDHITVISNNADSYEYFDGTAKSNITDLSVTAKGGTGDLSYQWYHNDQSYAQTVYGAQSPSFNPLGIYADNINESWAGEYYCVVTDQNGVTAKSKPINIVVKKTPTVKITEAAGEPTAYTNPANVPTPSVGSISIKTEKMNDALTLRADVSELNPTWVKWYSGTKNNDGYNFTEIQGAEGQTYSIPEGEKAAAYKVEVGFGYDQNADPVELRDGLSYIAEIKEISGNLEGGVLTSATGTFDGVGQNNPEYTITLPAGKKFKVAQNPDTTNLTYETLEQQYGVTIVSPKLAETDDLKTKFEVTNYDASNTVATLSFKHTAFDEQRNIVIANMEVQVTAQDNSVVNLPVKDGVGYHITRPVESWDLYCEPRNPVTYDGKPHAATVMPELDGNGKSIEGIGKIRNIRYAKASPEVHDAVMEDPHVPESEQTATPPTDVGIYYVYCDVDAGSVYGAAENVYVWTIVILPVWLNDRNAQDYFVISPTSVVHDGENHTPTVSFVKGYTNTGKIADVRYYYKDTQVEVTPLNIGDYDVYVKTVSDAQNPATNIAPTSDNYDPYVKAGTFSITEKAPDPAPDPEDKTRPTAELYTMAPVETVYTGKAQKPDITPKEGAGEVEAVHYLLDGAEIQGEPIDVGTYTVKIDTKANDKYAAVKELELGRFIIKEKSDEPDNPDTPDNPDRPIIYLRAHVQNQGWDEKLTELRAGQSETIGTTGLSRRLEAIDLVVPENQTVTGFAHVQNIGDTDVTKIDKPEYAVPKGYAVYRFGTTGRSLRMEALRFGIEDADGEMIKGLEYATHVQNYGWQGYAQNGSFAGTRGMSLRMEALRFSYTARNQDIAPKAEPRQ